MYPNKNDFNQSMIGSPTLNDGYTVEMIPSQDNPIFKPTTEDPYSEITRQILESEVYQQAYSLFSSDKKYGRIYLSQLEMIPYSIAQPEQTGWDKIGWSNNYDNQMRDSFDKAMTEIRNLVNNYYTFINSLPKSQLLQSIEAGTNVTGLNMSASQMDSSNPQKIGSDIESFSPGDAILGLGSLALSVMPNVVGTISNVISSLGSLRVSRRQVSATEKALDFNIESFVTNSFKTLAESGVDVFSLLPNRSEGVNFSLDDLKYVHSVLSTDPKYRDLQNHNAIRSIWSELERSSLLGLDSYDQIYGKYGYDLPRLMDDIAQSSLDTFVNTFKYRASLSKYNYEYQSKLSAGDASGATNAQNRMLKVRSDFEKMQNEQRLKFYEDQISRCSKSYDPVSKFVLSQMLFNDPWLSSVFGFEELNNGINSNGSNLLNPLNGGLLGLGMNVLPQILGEK